MKFIVKSKINYYHPNWNYLLFLVDEEYIAELVIGEDKDFIGVKSYLGNIEIFTLKKFAEIFKIIERINEDET